MLCCGYDSEKSEAYNDEQDYGGNFGPSSTLNYKDQHDLIKLCDLKSDSKWKLLYRASRDGFSAKDFHKKCDKKNRTLSIIKTVQGNSLAMIRSFLDFKLIINFVNTGSFFKAPIF